MGAPWARGCDGLSKNKSWNNPAIAGLKPGVRLPDAEIAVIHRSDDRARSSTG
jgi:phosphate transport system substrate-binding protein